jgi:cell wall-associated NlpC family hydrolase
LASIGSDQNTLKYGMGSAAPKLPAAMLIDEARKLCGSSFRHQGRGITGVDCIGMIAVAARNGGLDIPAFCGVKDRLDYSRQPDMELYQATAQFCTRTTVLKPGCAMLFKMYGARYPQHFALYTERGTIIHSNTIVGSVVENTYGAPWTRLLHSMWLLPGVIYE